MFESKSLFGDYHEMGHVWQGYKYCSKLQLVLRKRLTLSAALIFVTEGLFIYVYFLLFEENHQNQKFCHLDYTTL